MSNKKQPKVSRIWVKNTSGKPDAALTMLVISFLTVTGSYLASILGSLTVGALAMTFNAFDTSYASVVFLGLCGLYFGRRHTDANAETPVLDNNNDGYGQ